jgi:acyl-CoA thioesterase FadM
MSVEDRPAAKGKITVVCIDRETQRPRPLPERLAEALKHLKL